MGANIVVRECLPAIIGQSGGAPTLIGAKEMLEPPARGHRVQADTVTRQADTATRQVDLATRQAEAITRQLEPLRPADPSWRPTDIATLIILVVALYFAWRIAKGSNGGVPLYALAIGVPLCLFGVALAALVGNTPIVELLTVTAVAFSLALTVATPRFWEDELRADLEKTRVFQTLRAQDALSWTAWLKLVDRIGAARSALLFLLLEIVAMACAFPALLAVSAGIPVGFVLLTFAIPSLYAGLAAFWLYRAARRLVPGA
jgi:hypothetical protein